MNWTNRKLKDKKPFILKTAGGAAAQCLGLINAIYISQKLDRPFKLSHYPFSTGTYFPIAIMPLLHNDEIQEVAIGTKGLDLNSEPIKGAVIQQHPLVDRFLSYEKLLFVLRKIRLYNSAKSLMGEVVVDFSVKRLEKVSRTSKSISGGFIPLIDNSVMEEMRARFTHAGLQSPFSLVNHFSPDVVIHYRLGDKRKSFSELNLGIDGVVDPKTFRDILIRENLLNSPSIYVISDEPIIAQELLNSVKVIAHIAPTDNDIWSDIAFMAGARNAICSWSQVSQLAAVFNIFNGGKVFYANSSSTGFKPKWVIPGAIAFQPEFLQATHPIYQV